MVRQLWRNPTFRQTVVLAGLAAVVAVIFHNIGANLAQRGLSLSFEFLGRPASFDVPFTLIEFSTRDTYARAAFVALLNTLLVSALAIVTATVVGVAFGTFLLSPNPLLRRTAFGFVEFIKNTPQLLQLLFWYVVILSQLPSARESYQPLPGVFLNVRGLFLPKWRLALPEPATWASEIAILGAVLLALIGIATPFVPRKAGGWRRAIAAAALLAGALALWTASGAALSATYPELRGFNFKGGVQIVPELIALWIGLAIYASSFIADMVRGAVLAVPKGQEEAAYALGLHHAQTLWLIKLPQALRIVVPPLVSQYLNITKSSTLGIAIAYPEIMTVVGGTTLNQTGHAIEAMLIIMVVFIIINLAVSLLMNRYNRTVALRGSV
ncbi:MAG: ABC transporter permease subunit [Gammaproteobacteria bacterium]